MSVLQFSRRPPSSDEQLRVAPATRGVVWYRITLHGRAVHCGLAEPNDVDVVSSLEFLIKKLSAYHREVSAQSHSLLASPACRITRMFAGESHNSTAEKVELTVDRRMLPHETVDQVEEDLKRILASHQREYPGIEWQLEYLKRNEPTEIPLESRLVEVLGNNIRAVGKREIRYWGTPFGSDMRNFVGDSGIPAVNFGAGDFRVCHHPDEFVPIDELMVAARILMGTTVDLLQETGV